MKHCSHEQSDYVYMNEGNNFIFRPNRFKFADEWLKRIFFKFTFQLDFPFVRSVPFLFFILAYLVYLLT